MDTLVSKVKLSLLLGLWHWSMQGSLRCNFATCALTPTFHINRCQFRVYM